jgi:hypothetical protein
MMTIPILSMSKGRKQNPAYRFVVIELKRASAKTDAFY